MAVPNIFGTATSAIPLSQLDTNFATPVTIGNTAVQLGNTVTSFGNVTLTNVTISSGNVTITGANVSGTANVSTLIVTGNQTSLGNVTVTGNVSANIVTVSAGSNTAPSITTTGDTNTGIFFPAADTIAFSEGGTEAMRIDSSGNVGIGTNSPATSLYKLTLAGDTGAGSGVQIRSDSGTGAFSRIAFTRDSTDATTGLIRYSNSDYSMQFFTANGTTNGERMRITDAGDVGIGTTTPLFTFANRGSLTINGTNQALLCLSNGSSQSTSAYHIWDGTNYSINNNSTTGSLVFGTNAASERLRINASGDLLLAGSTAQKATGTTWSNPSDQRLKDNIRDYEKGIAELMQVRVREWEYNGKGGTTEGVKGLGVIADEVMTVLPDTVENYDAKLNTDDEETTAIKKFDATEITWLLVKTAQEQQALIQSLTTRITALENK